MVVCEVLVLVPHGVMKVLAFVLAAWTAEALRDRPSVEEQVTKELSEANVTGGQPGGRLGTVALENHPARFETSSAWTSRERVPIQGAWWLGAWIPPPQLCLQRTGPRRCRSFQGVWRSPGWDAQPVGSNAAARGGPAFCLRKHRTADDERCEDDWNAELGRRPIHGTDGQTDSDSNFASFDSFSTFASFCLELEGEPEII